MRSTVVALVVWAAVLAGCSADGDAPEQVVAEQTTSLSPSQAASPTSTASPSTSDPTPTPTDTETGTIITTASSQFGEILFDSSGQAIYLFDREGTTEPECYDECAEAWPPVLTKGAPAAAGDVRADALGTTERADGTTQITYADHPLYYYAHEGKNEVLCHNVREFGGLWLVLTASGEVP